MWPIFALGSAIFAATNSILQKETLQKLHAVQLMTVSSFFMVLFSIVLVPYVNFSLDLKQFSLVLLTSIVYAFAFIFTIKALRHMDVSIVAPFFNLGAAFTALFGYMIFKEHITKIDTIGIVLLFVGGYILELKHHNLLQPFKDLAKSKNIHYLLGGVVLFSVDYLLIKLVLESMEPLSYFFYQNIFSMAVFLLLTLFVYRGVKDIKRGFVIAKWLLPVIAITGMLETIFIYEALAHGPISLVVPIYRAWALFAVIFGGRILHEEHLLKRAVASVLMIFGAALILI